MLTANDISMLMNTAAQTGVTYLKAGDVEFSLGKRPSSVPLARPGTPQGELQEILEAYDNWAAQEPPSALPPRNDGSDE